MREVGLLRSGKVHIVARQAVPERGDKGEAFLRTEARMSREVMALTFLPAPME